MNPERWLQVRQVFDAAVLLRVAERSAYLDKICASDAELRQEVESLLVSHEQAASGFLDIPAINLKMPPAESASARSRVGRRIGAYDILEEIGHGGMGQVYRAVRADGQFTKEVAVKLVRGGFDTAFVLERFRHERQILAGLDHPNIARLLDGGTTDDGIPYLVMELVNGTPIDQYCDHHQLNVTERLRLFLQVCSAVQYAHQRLVIHRDIKPSNILVTAEGEPKLLDFGIAKILDPAASAETTMAHPMTPQYASPEQIRGEPITTATDVYSLGVVLYQLLTGHSPYPADTHAAHEFARAICELEPERPSTALLKAEPSHEEQVVITSPETFPGPREGSLGKLRRRLAGDLDIIVLKSLHKEPQRRYGSAEQLAEDIRRHLQGLPVMAAPDSLTYRAGKFVRRHKAGMAAAALILIAVSSGVAATVREARIAAANQQRAEKRFNQVRKLADSLMFEIHDSIQDLPGATTARKLIVQRSSEYLDTLAQEATGDVSLQRELASAYERLGAVQGDAYGVSMGDATGALQSFQKSLSIRQTVAHANPRSSEDLIALARAYEQVGRVQWFSLGGTREGLLNLRKAVSVADAVVHNAPGNIKAVEVLARGYQYLGDIEGGSGLRGSTADLRDALENHRKALPLLQDIANANSSDQEKTYLLARANIAVGDDYVRVGDAAQALDSYQQAEKIMKPVAESVSSSLYRRGYAVCHTRMGDALLMLARPAEALAHYRRELQLLRPLAAADPKDMVAQTTLVTAEGDVGHALVETGQVEEGKAALLHALARTVAAAERANDSYDRTLLASTEALVGEALERTGNADVAQRHYARALDLYSAIASADPADAEDAVNVVIIGNHLGAVRLKSGQAPAALRDYQTARERVESMASSNPDNIEVLYALADTFAGLGDVSAALAKSATSPSKKSGAWDEARTWYGKSLSTWQKIPHPGPVSPNGFRTGDPRDVARRAKTVEKLATGSSHRV